MNIGISFMWSTSMSSSRLPRHQIWQSVTSWIWIENLILILFWNVSIRFHSMSSNRKTTKLISNRIIMSGEVAEVYYLIKNKMLNSWLRIMKSSQFLRCQHCQSTTANITTTLDSRNRFTISFDMLCLAILPLHCR